VNPHGRRNVRAPIHGEYFGFLNRVIFRVKNNGRVNPLFEIFGTIQRSCSPRYARTNPTKILKNQLKSTEPEKFCQSIPRINPPIVNVTIRHI
jgi:hypothetical protein